MIRFRDAALVASLFGAMPVLAGTSIAKSQGMDTPALSPASIPVTGEAPPATAAEGAQGVFEALIADFRHGDPEMGAVPHLPVPPPLRMRAEEAAESGDEAPLDGNNGNPLPLHFVHLSLPPPTEFVKLPEVPPTPPPVVTSRQTPADLIAGTPVTRGIVREPQSAGTGATDLPGKSPTVMPAGNASMSVADTDRAALDALVRQLTPNESVALPDTNGARHREPAVATPTDTVRVADRLPPPATPTNAASTPTPPALASAIERAVDAAAATTRSRHAARDPRGDASGSRASLDSAANFGTERVPMRPGANEAARVLERPTRDFLPEVSFERAAASQPDPSFAIAVNTPSAAQASSVATRPDAPVLHLDTPVTQPEWADGIGERIVWLSDNRVNDAQIRLNPAHLGPVEVRVSVGEDQTSVSFIAHHAATREALESAAPRLREMLAAQGFGTVNVNISHQSSGERTAQNPQPHAWIGHDAGSTNEYPADASTRPARSSSKTLDAYA